MKVLNFFLQNRFPVFQFQENARGRRDWLTSAQFWEKGRPAQTQGEGQVPAETAAKVSPDRTVQSIAPSPFGFCTGYSVKAGGHDKGPPEGYAPAGLCFIF